VIMVGKNVVIYSLPTWPHCKRAKEYLSQIGTPVILVNDEMVVGFNRSKLDKLLSN
jgi:glutaredoxin